MRWIISLTLAIGALALGYMAWILFLMGVDETARLDAETHPFDD